MGQRGSICIRAAAARLVTTVLVGLALAACTSATVPGTGDCGGSGQGGPSPACSYPPTAPPGVADEASAIARARDAVAHGDATTTVVWAAVQPAGSDVPPEHDWLWVVRLEGPGLDQSPCPSGYLDGAIDLSAPPCLDGEGGIDVVMDAFSTEVLGTWH